MWAVNAIWQTVVSLLLLLAVADAQEEHQASRDVERLYEDAQRYHLGIDRPVDLRKAVELYWEVVQQDPKHADAYHNLAYLCFVQKRYDLAGGYYRQVIKLRPTDGHAYNNLGAVYEKQGKIKLAQSLYRKAIQVDPDMAPAHYNLSRFLMKEGKAEEASAEIEEALRLDPGNEDYVKLQSQARGKAGKISYTTVGAVAGAFVGVLIIYAMLMRNKRA